MPGLPASSIPQQPTASAEQRPHYWNISVITVLNTHYLHLIINNQSSSALRSRSPCRPRCKITEFDDTSKGTSQGHIEDWLKLWPSPEKRVTLFSTITLASLGGFLQGGGIACNAQRCISRGNSVCPSVRLSVRPSVFRHTLVRYPDE